MKKFHTRVAIAGGGIGGLVMALQLERRGIECMVFEAAEKLEPLGVGINLLPHSVKILAALGLLDELSATAIETSELAYFNKHGQAIWREPRGIAAGYDVPQFSIHRGELHMLLYRHAVARLGEDHVLTGHAIKRFDTGAAVGVVAGIVAGTAAGAATGTVNPAITTRATAVFENRRSGAEVAEVSADLIIAADGIHSTVRASFYPDEGPPKYSGRVLWRGTCIAPPFLTGRSMMQAGHANQKAVVYPISRKVFEETGQNLTNWIMELVVPGSKSGEAPPKQDWSKRVDKRIFAGPFANWKWDWLDVPALIEHGGDAYEYPMCDRDPLPRWSHGRVTLLGDAAHPMYPIGSNGASQAILDTESLANALAAVVEGTGFAQGNVAPALARYEAERREATGKIVLANRGNGPDQVMQLAEERAPGGFKHVNDVIPQEELEAISARYKQTAGFAKAQVNSR